MRTQPQALQPTPPTDPAAPARPDPLGAWWVLAIATLLMLGRARLALRRGSESRGADPRSRLVHVAGQRRDAGRSRIDRPRMGSERPVLRRLPRDGAARGRAAPARRRHRHLHLREVPDARRADPHRARLGRRRGPKSQGSGGVPDDAARHGRVVPHDAVRRVPRQHHGPVPAGVDAAVPPGGEDVVGRANGPVPDRDRRGIHAPHHLRAVRRDAPGRVRLPPRHVPVPARLGAPLRRPDAPVGRARAWSSGWRAGWSGSGARPRA